MVVAKKKLDHPSKKATTIASIAEPTLVMAPAMLTAPSKRPHPEAKMAGNVARPQKRLKKKAKNEE